MAPRFGGMFARRKGVGVGEMDKRSQLYVVGGNCIFRDGSFVMHIDVKVQCCTPETYINLYTNFTSFLQKGKNTERRTLKKQIEE